MEHKLLNEFIPSCCFQIGLCNLKEVKHASRNDSRKYQQSGVNIKTTEGTSNSVERRKNFTEEK